jgi:hypothetical protein
MKFHILKWKGRTDLNFQWMRVSCASKLLCQLLCSGKWLDTISALKQEKGEVNFLLKFNQKMYCFLPWFLLRPWFYSGPPFKSQKSSSNYAKASSYPSLTVTQKFDILCDSGRVIIQIHTQKSCDTENIAWPTQKSNSHLTNSLVLYCFYRHSQIHTHTHTHTHQRTQLQMN